MNIIPLVMCAVCTIIAGYYAIQPFPLNVLVIPFVFASLIICFSFGARSPSVGE